jgi:hypothetical protein
MKTYLVMGVTVLLILVSHVALFPAQRWVLPVADGADTKPSPPSVHGYLIATAKQRIALKPDSRDNKTARVDVQLTTKTQFFTDFGGFLTPSDLRSGQYVWVWYVTANPAQAGTPPRAAVVMLYTEDPADKPSQKVRFSFDSKK